MIMERKDARRIVKSYTTELAQDRELIIQLDGWGTIVMRLDGKFAIVEQLGDPLDPARFYIIKVF